MAESVKVIVRCRPMNKRETDLCSRGVVFMENDTCSCSIVNPDDNHAPPKTFTFDGVYNTDSTTEQIYNDIGYPLVESVLEGYNSTVFAYGQTGCGKSFTMQGVINPSSQRGIIPRAFEHIFEAVSVAESTKYLVLASYLEIYNEDIRDLLGNDVKRRLDLKEHPEKGIYVQDLSQHPVHNVSECEELMERGWRNRATGATLMNSDSSRSHSIFSINLEMMPACALEEDGCSRGSSGGGGGGGGRGSQIRRGKLNLVDLAGSERQAKTGATGERLKEATKINLSLSALGNVISALVDGKSKHIPYRDSKLTRLLQDSLGGNTKTLMVACLSPADNNYDETLSTLRYANRAKNIQNKPRINEDPKDTMLREYQDEIKKLRAMLDGSQSINGHSMEISAASLLEEEKEKVRREYEEKMQQMREHYEAEQNHKYQLQEDMQRLKIHYEEELKKISEQEKQTLINGKNRSFAVSSPVGGTPAEIVDALKKEKKTITPAQQEILSRLQKLQKSMVGGERANDSEAKERRLRKKRASERRLQALAQVLSKVDDEDGVVLQVYDDIQQTLRLTTESLKKVKYKAKEDIDIYEEKLKQKDKEIKIEIEMKLKYKKIAEEIAKNYVPLDSNYKNIEYVMEEMRFDGQQWICPKPHPVGQYSQHNLLPAASPLHLHSNRSSGSSDKSSKSSSPPKNRMSSPEFMEDEDRSFIQRLQRSEEEDIAGNYFKPKRATELLNRAKEDASRAFNTWRDYTNQHKGNSTNGLNNILNASLSQNGLHSSLNALNLNTSTKTNGFLNNSWGASSTTNNVLESPRGNGWIGNGTDVSPELNIRRPVRLQALPVLEKKYSGKRKDGKSELNTMDII